MQPGADVRDVVLEELAVRRRAFVDLQHQRDQPAWVSAWTRTTDLESDPDEVRNLTDKRSGLGKTAAAERERRRLHDRLELLCAESGTTEPALPSAR